MSALIFTTYVGKFPQGLIFSNTFSLATWKYFSFII